MSSDDTNEEKKTPEKKKRDTRPLPLTESLVFDIVDYLLANEGYGFSTEISEKMVQLKPRRYTSREVIGVLRNRPMFKHAQSKDRRGGIRWRLDLLALVKYLDSKNFVNRAEERGVFDRLRELKWRQIVMTITALQELIGKMEDGEEPDNDTLDKAYESLATVWS
tara:strand:- start:6806 stop:7300 length:495 start_codon:yes stop_codon:yes gene_type:complete